MNKIEKIYTLLQNRLPSNYIVPIKCFKTTKQLLKYYSKHFSKRSYKEVVKYFTEYFKNPKTNTYIKTKYLRYKERATAFDIKAMSTIPILISLENVRALYNYEIAFILLHEIGHIILREHNEKKCDLFASRWTKKLIKEGLIKCGK